MDYTIITIHGPKLEVQNLQTKLTDAGNRTFNYKGVFPTPPWVDLAPLEEAVLVKDLSTLQKIQLEKAVREISLNITFRTWILTVLEKCCEIVEDPWANIRRPAFDINHTIFNVRACDLFDELSRMVSLRQKSINELFTEEVALVVNYFLCRQLDKFTGHSSRAEWFAKTGGGVMDGKVVETDFRYDAKESHVSYVVQTLGGTPWPFFKTLSSNYPQLRFTVSDVDTGNSIIQMKIYSAGRITTTLATEDTSAVKHMDIHTAQAFGGVYFYLPLTC